jgi:hypothetical protein
VVAAVVTDSPVVAVVRAESEHFQANHFHQIKL